MHESCVSFSDVTVGDASAPGRVVAAGVNWSVNEGEFWVVGGLPGTGKTQILLAAAGLLSPLRGKAMLFGREPAVATEEEFVEARKRTGFVFGYGGRLFSRLTVAENVALPICYHADQSMAQAGDRVRALLEALQIEDSSEARPDQVPRILLPRVGLARALALGPDIVFLDNPLAGLDVRQLRWWLELLKRLNDGTFPPMNKPVAVVAGTDDLRPWLGVGSEFALVHDQQWNRLGDAAAVERNDDPVVRDLAGSD